MRRISPIILGSIGAAACLIHAQQPPASPVPEQRQPAGYVRLWHFANSIKSQIAAALSGGDSGQLIILGRSTPPAYLMNYRDVPPGRYKLTVHAATADKAVDKSKPEIVPSIEITVGDRTFQTVIIQDQANRSKAVVFNDGTVGAGIPRGGKRLRMFDFAANQDASLRSFPDNQVIFAHITPGSSQYMFSKNPGELNVVMTNKLPNGYEGQQNAQLDFNRVDSITAVLMFDRYGRLTFQAVEDARAD